MKQLKITAFFICLFIMASVIAGNSQTVRKDANGNYYAVKMAKDSTGGAETGKTFTATDGTKYPVMMSKNGKLYVIRQSKNGTTYKQYLKLEN